MNNSLILNYIDRNINRLQALDYVLLGIAALAVLFVLFLAARGLYRLLQSKKRSMQGVLPSASLASQYRDLVRQASAERSLLERQASGGGESF
ncbi:MAG TPA: hypothetical protein DCS42_14990, partial [Nitrospiraceae bacterium]|nr:hypothetical protein [Nitrospiraceae bacterium]